jgi:hypothetical protein
MKLSSRENLLKESEKELTKIRKYIKETDTPGWNPSGRLQGKKQIINTQKEWEEFLKKYGGQYQVFGDNWYETLQKIVNDGNVEINIDSLNPDEKRRAKNLLKGIEGELNRLKTGNVYGTTIFFKILTMFLSLITLLGALAFLENDNSNIGYGKEKKIDFLKKLKNAPHPNKSLPSDVIKWIKSVISMIKK